MVYELKGDHQVAIKYYFQALKQKEQIRDHKGIPYCLLNIGNLYYQQKNSSKAIKYYQKSLALNRQNKDTGLRIRCLNNLALVYGHRGQYAEALEYYAEIQALCRQTGHKESLADSELNMGLIYDAQKDYPAASLKFQESLRIYTELGNTEGILLCQLNIAAYEMKTGQYTDARQRLMQGRLLAEKLNSLRYQIFFTEAIYKTDSALGDYQSAFEHHKLYKQYSDSLHNEDKAKEFGRVESKYQFEKEAEEQKRQEAELAKIEGEKRERRNNLQYLTIFAGLIGLFAGLVFIGKFSIPTRVMDIAVFAGLLILFEFLLILFDPLFDQYSGGIPFYKLGFNTVVAFGFAPLHGFLEDKLKKRLVKTK